MYTDEQIVVSLIRQLSWTHFLAVIPLKDPLKRDFYAEMCRIERWSVRTLRKKIELGDFKADHKGQMEEGSSDVSADTFAGTGRISDSSLKPSSPPGESTMFREISSVPPGIQQMFAQHHQCPRRTDDSRRETSCSPVRNASILESRA